MGATTLAGTATIQAEGSIWVATWRDQVGRLVVRKLGQVDEIDRAGAGLCAYQVAQRYVKKYERDMRKRAGLTRQQLEELSEASAFPRQVVAYFVERVFKTIRLDHDGSCMQGFIVRTGISERELHRIIHGDDRVSVSIPIVDRICTEFGLNFYDFTSCSEEWATKTGVWKNREGALDPWPVGYTDRSSGGEDFDL